MAKKKGNMIGGWAFLIGVVLAVVFGFIGVSTNIALILAVIGIIVGLLNIADQEVTPFLMSGVVLIIASSLGGDAVSALGSAASGILSALSLIFVPATIIVAIKNVMSLAKR